MTRANPPIDIHADAARHNAADATFLHNMLGSLQGSANHARAVITEGKHPDVKAAARDIVSTHSQQMTAIKGLAARLGVSTAAAASSSSPGPAGQGGGNAYGRSVEMRAAGAGHRSMGAGADDESTLQAHLEDLCAGLSDDDLHELAALAEAMHADGGV